MPRTPVSKSVKGSKKVVDDSSSDEDVDVALVDTKKGKKTTPKVSAPAKGKKETKKTTKESQDDGSDDSDRSDHEEPKQTKEGSGEHWNEMSRDDVDQESNANNDDDGQEHDGGQEHSTQQSGKFDKGARRSRHANSAINFDYEQYESLTLPVNKLSSMDLVKVLVVRSYKEGQFQLCKVMKQTLRAMNLECDFPGNKEVPYQSDSRGAGNGKFRNNYSANHSGGGHPSSHPRGNATYGTDDFDGTSHGTRRFGAGNKRPQQGSRPNEY